jgi:hypothetical protein
MLFKLPISSRWSTDAPAGLMSRRLAHSTMLTTWTWFQHLATGVRRRPSTELRRFLRPSSAEADGGWGRWGNAKLHAALHVLSRLLSSHFAGGLAAKTSDSCACNLPANAQRSLPCRSALCCITRLGKIEGAEGPVPHRSCLSHFCFASVRRAESCKAGSAPCNARQGPLQAPPVDSNRRPNIRGSGLPRPCSLSCARHVTALAKKNAREPPISLPLRA